MGGAVHHLVTFQSSYLQTVKNLLRYAEAQWDNTNPARSLVAFYVTFFL